jgi:outer membrane protein TolC
MNKRIAQLAPAITLLALPIYGQDSNPSAPLRLPDAPYVQRNFVLPANSKAGALPRSRVQLTEDREYKLPELIDIGERQHPETRIAWDNARNAALGAGIAESTYLPRVTANVIGGYQGSTGNSSSSGNTANGSAHLTGSISALSLEWLLFDFGGRKHIVGAARDVSDASTIAFTGAHQRVIYAVSMSYYAYLAALQRRQTDEGALSNAKEIEAGADARYKHGEGTVLETSQSHELTAQSQLALVQAQGAEQDSYIALLAAMGLSPLNHIRIAQVDPHPLSADELTPVEQIVQGALERRPDVLAAYSSVQASETSIKAAEAQNLPKIFLAGTGAYVSGQLDLTAIPGIGQQIPTFNISGNHWNSTILLGMTIPVFDGRQRANAIQQAKNSSEKAKATLDEIRLDAAREVVSAQNSLRTSIAANQAALALRSAAQTAYDAALDSYHQGVGTVTATVAAQTQLLQAQLAADDAYIEALSAAASLAFATGTLGSAPR